MKKRKWLITISVLAILVLLPSMTAFARAGGGGGGGGCGTSSSSSSSSSSRRPRTLGDTLASIVSFGVFGVIALRKNISDKIELSKRKKKVKKVIKKLEKIDPIWKLKDINNSVEEGFYKIQTAWMEREQKIAIDYVSDKLYSSHKSKLDWMIIKHEKNILDNVHLIKATPIGINDSISRDCSCIWFCVKGRMVDYIVDDRTLQIKEGNTRAQTFSEYWKYIYDDSKGWVLDCILQTDDVAIHSFDCKSYRVK